MICVQRCGRCAASTPWRCGAAAACAAAVFPPLCCIFPGCPRQVRLFSVIKYESVIHEFVSAASSPPAA